MEKKTDYLFEVSFEVCNKIGGIHTVVSTKASHMKRIYGENYFLVGPYFKEKARLEFDELDYNELPFSKALEEMKASGIDCKFGVWRINGDPYVILVDFGSLMEVKNDIKARFWEWCEIDSLRAGRDFEEPLVWSYAAGMLLDRIFNQLKDKQVVFHFHEWLSGGALLYLWMKNPNAATVFTTHATMLGRVLAHNVNNFHELVEEGIKKNAGVDEKLAYDYGIEAKHQMEKKCAETAKVFTTVSEIMSDECQFILGKRPDLVLPNGIDRSEYPSPEITSYLHVRNKKKLLDFLRSYFSPYYEIRTDRTRLIFISGRYEFKNKGMDVFIKALGRVNANLKAEGCETDYFALILVPSDVRVERQEILENVSLYRSIDAFVDEIADELKSRLVEIISNRRGGALEDRVSKFFTKDELLRMRKLSISFQNREGNAPLTPFVLNYDENRDNILRALKENGLLNRKEDRVKVVFYPVYLSISDRLLGMDYKSVVIGCSAGIFPSYYEPWGYTPLETAALGVIAVTTDLSGYGKFIIKAMERNNKEKQGVIVLKRKGKREDEVVRELANTIYTIFKYSKEEISLRKRHALELAKLSDWGEMVKNYVLAHNMALEKPRKAG